MIYTIIFDLGGVLIDWNPRYLYRKIFDQEAEMEHFLSEVCSPAWNHEQDAGRPLEEATALLLAQFPQYEREIRAFYGRWEEMLGGAVADSVKLQQRILRDDRFRVFALTNWSHQTFPIARRLYPFLADFEDILVSGEEKLAKPDPQIYEVALARFQAKPEHSLFIDDSLKNIEAARALGIQSLHFQDPDQLEQALRERNLLIPV
jgi:2-haloacid dehalogenase